MIKLLIVNKLTELILRFRNTNYKFTIFFSRNFDKNIIWWFKNIKRSMKKKRAC